MSVLEQVNQHIDKENKFYDGEYLNRSTDLLYGKFDYEQVALELHPLRKEQLGKMEFRGRVIFDSTVKGQYGADIKQRKTFNINCYKARQCATNFVGKEHMLLPWFDGEFYTSGHFHPYYKDISLLLEQSLIDDTELIDKVWWSLLHDNKNDFKPTDFGLLVLMIHNNEFIATVKYNGFEWQTKLLWDTDRHILKSSTVSRKICKL